MDVLLRCRGLDLESNRLGVRIGKSEDLADFVGEGAWKTLSVGRAI